METILTINAGSSSLKFQVFATDGSKELRRLIKGQMDGIGTRPRLCAQGADRNVLINLAPQQPRPSLRDSHR